MFELLCQLVLVPDPWSEENESLDTGPASTKEARIREYRVRGLSIFIDFLKSRCRCLEEQMSMSCLLILMTSWGGGLLRVLLY